MTPDRKWQLAMGAQSGVNASATPELGAAREATLGPLLAKFRRQGPLPTYPLAVLRLLCPRGPEALLTHELREDGLWVREDLQGLTEAERNVLLWHPSRRRASQPALPVPFTVPALAAFMLCGGGSILRGQVVENLDPNAQDAVEAYAAAVMLCEAAEADFGTGPGCDLTEELAWRAAALLIAAPTPAHPGITGDVLLGDTAARDHRPLVVPRGRKTRGRRDTLQPVIEKCCNKVEDPSDVAQVMGELQRLARLPEGKRPTPLIGMNERGEVRWQEGAHERALSRRNLGDRIRRVRARSPFDC